MAADATIGPIDNTTTANIRGQTQRLELAREHATVNFAVASDQGDLEHGAHLDTREISLFQTRTVNFLALQTLAFL
jgi:hypothetical protein